MNANKSNSEWTPPQPAETEKLGQRVAREATELKVDTVLTWNEPEDTVLGHVVARELGIGTVYANEVEGILDTFGSLDGLSVLIVFAGTPRETEITALTGLVENSNARVAMMVGPEGKVSQ